MKRTIYLARHASHAEVGKILSGRSEIALNAQGQAEARRLAGRLASVPLAAIHSSPRRRAIETAEAVLEGRGLDVRRASELDEIDFGAWAGRSFSDLESNADWQRWNAERATAATPAGETMGAVAARAFDYLVAIPGDGPVLCVSHCDVIRGVIAEAIGLSFDRMFSFDCEPASLTTLEIDGAAMQLVTLNEHPQ